MFVLEVYTTVSAECLTNKRQQFSHTLSSHKKPTDKHTLGLPRFFTTTILTSQVRPILMSSQRGRRALARILSLVDPDPAPTRWSL